MILSPGSKTRRESYAVSNLDTGPTYPDIRYMSQQLPETRRSDNSANAELPSLADAFAPEREALRQLIVSEGLTANATVQAARIALERTGERFAREVQDIHIQRTGLWLLEMVKAGAGILDKATKADIVWKEVPRAPVRLIAGSTVFYGAALVFFVAGFVQGSRLAMMASTILAALRFFDPKDWKHFILNKIPFLQSKTAPLLEAPGGRALMADAHISVEAGGYADALAEALRTADHVLARLAEPQAEFHWSGDPRLLGFMQSLLEAKGAKDSEFALKLVGGDLESILAADGIEIVNYSKKTAKLFDILPALDMKAGQTKQAAPALVRGDHVLRRGTVWKSL